MSAYITVTAKIKNKEKFQHYLDKVQDTANPFGAVMIARTKGRQVLTGLKDIPDLIVFVKFPSLKHILDWYESPSYQSLIPIREEGADMTITVSEDL